MATSTVTERCGCFYEICCSFFKDYILKTAASYPRRVGSLPEDRGNKFLRNVRSDIPYYVKLCPRRYNIHKLMAPLVTMSCFAIKIPNIKLLHLMGLATPVTSTVNSAREILNVLPIGSEDTV